MPYFFLDEKVTIPIKSGQGCVLNCKKTTPGIFPRNSSRSPANFFTKIIVFIGSLANCLPMPPPKLRACFLSNSAQGHSPRAVNYPDDRPGKNSPCKNGTLERQKSYGWIAKENTDNPCQIYAPLQGFVKSISDIQNIVKTPLLDKTKRKFILRHVIFYFLLGLL